MLMSVKTATPALERILAVPNKRGEVESKTSSRASTGSLDPIINDRDSSSNFNASGIVWPA